MTTEKILQKFDLTFAEVKEYAKLKEKIFGKGVLKELFVELDLKNNKDHIRFNALSGKMVHLNAYLVTHRNTALRG